MERRTRGKQCRGIIRTIRQYRAHGRADKNFLNPLEKMMQAIQELTKVLSARLVDTRARRDAERQRTVVLRERRDAKDTMKYADFAELRASALVD